MSETLRTPDLPGLSWLEIDLQLQAHAAPRRAHPMVVLEALLKGVFEAAGLDARHTKQLWHCPGHNVHDLGWQAGSTLPLTVQLFGLNAAHVAHWQTQLVQRFAPPVQQNFSLLGTSAWRMARVPSSPLPDPASHLDFLTPVPLPHTPGQPQTNLDGAGFLRLCQTRLRKLFGREAELPPPPTLDTSAWRYWRFEHRSRSQNGHPMFIHGCVGPLHLGGPHLAAWQPWLALLAAVGLGERLTFGQGRFRLLAAAQATADENPSPIAPPVRAPLQLRRPFVLDSEQPGARLELAQGNLVVNHDNQPPLKLPLMRLAHIELHSPCQISTPLLEACAREGIPLLLGTPGQTPLVIAGQAAEAQRHRRLAAHHASWAGLDAAQRAQVAARCVQAKLDGCEWLVRQRYQVGDHLLLAQLQRARQALGHTERLPMVRGWEGWAARHYHRWLQQHLQPLGDFQQRQQHGESQNPVNSLLNYGYGLLRHHLARAVRVSGLDPWLGILHEANDRHEALVSDLMEPWRVHIDRLVLRQIGLRIIQPNSFGLNDGHIRLLPPARARMVQDFNRMLKTPVGQGGPQLATRMQQMLTSYASAAQQGTLAQWSVPMGNPPEPDAEADTDSLP